MFDVAGLEQLVDHVEHQQGQHAVIGEPLPGLGEGQVAQAHGVAQEPALGAGKAGVNGGGVSGHGGS